MLTIFLVAWFLALLVSPFYLIYLSLVIRRVWANSRVHGVLMVLAIPVLLAFLFLPTLTY